MSDSPPAALNTDRELWREVEDDYYANSLHVTERGGIGMNVGGYVIVKPLAEWHKLAARALADTQSAPEPEDRRAWMKEGHQAQAVASSPEAADTRRLDWIQERWRDGVHAEVCAKGESLTWHAMVPAASVFAGPETFKGATLREALDAAIAASGLSADARSNDTTTGGLKERPEPALTDAILSAIYAELLEDEPDNDADRAYNRGIEDAYEAARKVVRAALSHRSTEEPADPEGARDRHAAAAAALLGPGYRLKP